MLIITRRRLERTILTATEDIPAGTEFAVEIFDIRPSSVRIGFAFPLSVNIAREELLGLPGGDVRGEPQAFEGGREQ